MFRGIEILLEIEQCGSNSQGMVRILFFLPLNPSYLLVGAKSILLQSLMMVISSI
jgi:hypothetical protein